jgi:hypothetical protein
MSAKPAHRALYQDPCRLRSSREPPGCRESHPRCPRPQTKALSGNIDAQHSLQPYLWRNATFASRIERLDRVQMHLPRCHCLNLAQNPISSRHPSLGRIFKNRKFRMYRQVSFKSYCHASRRNAAMMHFLTANKQLPRKWCI